MDHIGDKEYGVANKNIFYTKNEQIEGEDTDGLEFPDLFRGEPQAFDQCSHSSNAGVFGTQQASRCDNIILRAYARE